jgi:hypothetical protein
MGLKYGMAALAANRGLYVPLKLNDGLPFPLAKVFFGDRDKGTGSSVFLRYPDGTLGHLVLSGELQLEICFLEPNHWVPTQEEVQVMSGGFSDEQKKRLVIFEGEHEVTEFYGDTFHA